MQHHHGGASEYAMTERTHPPRAQALLMMQLRHMCPHLPLDPPPKFARTAWDADPMSLCSYSFLAAGATPRDRARLSEPLFDGRLWLAGEHTCVDRPSTVHGAYLSGERTARGVSAALRRLGEAARADAI